MVVSGNDAGVAQPRDSESGPAVPVYPYEAEWRPLVAPDMVQVTGTQFGLRAVAVVVPFVIGCAMVLISRGKPMSWIDAVGFVLMSIVPTVEIVVFVVMAQRGKVRGGRGASEGDGGVRPLSSNTQDTDAPARGCEGGEGYVVPSVDEIRDREFQGAGFAFPLVRESSPVAEFAHPVGTAWKIPGASGLRVAGGVVISSLSLPIVKTVRRYDGYSGDGAVVCVYEVEFRDACGKLRRMWTDATPSRFAPGQNVIIYYYAVLRPLGSPFIRIHDVSDARYPMCAEEHQVVVFSMALFKCTEGSVGNPQGPGSYGAWAYAQPWGRLWRTRVCQIGYSENREVNCGESEQRDSRILPTRVSDFAVGGEKLAFPQTEGRVGIELGRGEGVVEDVVVVPLFNRRFWCGFGYMALVRFVRRGRVGREWAFCDPGRADSYLGDDAARLRVVPVGVGDRVTLWRAWDGLCVVEPRG
ncbi:hypothetical protein PSRA_1370 [Pseudoscardovia radai]|uniref:Uncharacterized protein n=1 Tax=Pseudoscardovia radai TaxID=987066 RepID=A0A261EVC9_9BIFI|nr:hypothetical protein [Pseudoscardovia radai]OZG50803.1 hypothetical protein PSRA_1370 [Pseudoscardovia radai]